MGRAPSTRLPSWRSTRSWSASSPRRRRRPPRPLAKRRAARTSARARHPRASPCRSGCSSRPTPSDKSPGRTVGFRPYMALRFTTAGESHGPGLTAVVEGLPAGLILVPEDIDRDLARRQLGHGRGGRMKIEKDRAEVTSGLRHGRTLGSPVSLRVVNRDFANWEEGMTPWPVEASVDEVPLPRPGHADLAGVQKFGFT